MDKNTLSHYGWIVIAIIISSIMLMYISPFGETFLSTSDDTLSKVIDNSNLEPTNKTVPTFNLSIKYFYNSAKNTIYVSDKSVSNPNVNKYIFYDEIGQKSFYGFITTKDVDFTYNNANQDNSVQYLNNGYSGNFNIDKVSEIKIKSPEFNFAYTSTKYYTLSNDEIKQVQQGNNINVNIEYTCKQYQINYYLYDYESDSFVLYQSDSYISGYGCPLVEPTITENNNFSGWFSDKIECKQQCATLNNLE